MWLDKVGMTMFVGEEFWLLANKYLSLVDDVNVVIRRLLYNSLSKFFEPFEFDITELADDEEGNDDG